MKAQEKVSLKARRAAARQLKRRQEARAVREPALQHDADPSTEQRLLQADQMAAFLEDKFGRRLSSTNDVDQVIKEIEKLVVDRFRDALTPTSADAYFRETPSWKFKGAYQEGKGIRPCYSGPLQLARKPFDFAKWVAWDERRIAPPDYRVLLLWNADVCEKMPRSFRQRDVVAEAIAARVGELLVEDIWQPTATPFAHFRPKASRHGHSGFWLARQGDNIDSQEELPASGPILLHDDAEILVSFFNGCDAVFEGFASLTIEEELWACWLFVGPARVAVAMRRE